MTNRCLRFQARTDVYSPDILAKNAEGLPSGRLNNLDETSGMSVSAMKTAATMTMQKVTTKSFMKSMNRLPPPRKTRGMKTQRVVAVAAMMAMVTSRVPTTAAIRAGRLPSCRWR